MRLIQYDANGKIVYCGSHPNLPVPCVVCEPEYVENMTFVTAVNPVDYHQLWHELHTEVRTAEQFEAWVKRVPSFGCGCQSWLKDYLAKNDFSDGDLAEYGWRLHNAVNAKLRAEGKDRPEFSWAEFETKYG